MTTTIRVTEALRDDLNLLKQLGHHDNIDVLIMYGCYGEMASTDYDCVSWVCVRVDNPLAVLSQ